MHGQNQGGPEVIVRRRRHAQRHEARHGGSWKIAFADFMTAMMALFLLLWLVNLKSDEYKKGIADFFNPMALDSSRSASDGMLAGEVTEGSAEGGAGGRDRPEGTSQPDGAGGYASLPTDEGIEDLREDIVARLSAAVDLETLAENVVIEVTPEGLRIQVTDRDKVPMFPVGSSGLTPQGAAIVQAIGSSVAGVPNQIAITGHTDGLPYRGNSGFDNWDLSAGRANSARRVLAEAGVPAERIARVEGIADRDHLVPEDPADPRNRRIGITVLRQR